MAETKDERDFLDENGNDLRYGVYYFGIWRPYPESIIALKKSGEWDKMINIEKRWEWTSTYWPTPEEAVRRRLSGKYPMGDAYRQILK
jgi:hypothetical protein